MFTSFISLCKSFPVDFWCVLGGLLGVSSITTPIAFAILITNSGTINYKAGDTEIMLQGKELTSVNTENMTKLQAQIKEQNQAILKLTAAAKEKKLEQKLKPQLKELQQDIQESEIRLEDAQKSQEELIEYVEEQSN